MFNKNVLNPFLEIVKNKSDHHALCIGERFYTYRDLAENISKIRKALQSSDHQSNQIGLIANDDIETYAAIFAIWLEGLAYVPIHPRQPVERSVETISQANIDLVIDSSENKSFATVQTIESGRLKFVELVLDPKPAAANALAYILFTSGTTGKPKGVPIMRSSLGAFMKSFFKVGFKIHHSDRCLQCFDLTFDVSVQSFLAPLVKGACVYTIPHDQIKYSYVYGLLVDHKLTFGVMAPSMLRYLRPYFNELHIPSMRYCILTAEASPVDLLAEWSQCIPNSEIYDFYGPTEATIYCTYYQFHQHGKNKHLNGMLSIGKVMSGMTAIIIDEQKKVLGPNQQGELCIAGAQLTPGYWNQSEKTTESFLEIERGGQAERFYKTGDSCCFDKDGDILLAGRLDDQVKIQGYRIELGEIEYHARKCLPGQNARAIAFENKNGNSEIAMFVEGESDEPGLLLEYLQSKLPYYMIPTKILFIRKFPLNANGKIDRARLKQLRTP